MPHNAITYEEVQKLCNVSRETFAMLEEFVTLIEKWNRSINLISKTASLNDLWHRHMIDSMQLFRHIPNATVLTDFGSGGGFPGIILSFMGVPDVHLIESDKRKCAFLTEAARLSKHKIHVHNARIESLDPWKSDVITARGLAPLPALLDWVAPFMQENTLCLFQKGKNAAQELAEAETYWQMETTILPSITSPEASILKLASLQRKGTL